MEPTERFYDFCIPYNANEKVMCEILDESLRLGYKTVAIEQVFDHSKKDVKKRGADIFPEPVGIKHLTDKYANKLKILQRLTITYVDNSVVQAMSSSLILKKYNLIAGQPKTEAALTHCCTAFNGDIITFDSEAGAKLLLHRKPLKVALQRKMYFEIKYSHCIRDSNNRKDMIRMAHQYFLRGKRKNIILSSSALDAFELRGPHEVAFLAFIFGLSEDQGKNAVNTNCRQLYINAESRRIGKTIMFTKHRGPIVFSDTSDEDDNDKKVEEDNEKDEENNEKDEENNEEDEEDNEESENSAMEEDSEEKEEDTDSDSDSLEDLNEQPKKKKKLV